MSAFPFIEAERAEQHNVAKACELLEVSRSAYYEHAKHLPSARALADADLAERIEAIYDDSRGTYGCPRFHAGLRPEGVHASKDAARERQADRASQESRRSELRSRTSGAWRGVETRDRPKDVPPQEAKRRWRRGRVERRSEPRIRHARSAEVL